LTRISKDRSRNQPVKEPEQKSGFSWQLILRGEIDMLTFFTGLIGEPDNSLKLYPCSLYQQVLSFAWYCWIYS
jgi:hypothetical protein